VAELVKTRIVQLEDVAYVNPRLSEKIDPSTSVSFVGMADVSAERAITEAEYVRPYGEVSKGYTTFQNGDLLVAKITPCFENGKIGQARLSHRIGFGSTEFHVVRPDPELAHDRFLLYFLRSPQFRVPGEVRMTGSGGQRRVPVDYVKQAGLYLPPLSEQRRIAAILDKVEELRTKRRDALVKLDALTQSVFHTMFALSDKWPLSSVGLLADVVGGVQVSSKRGSLPVEVPYLRVANVYRGALDLEEIKTIRVTDKELNRVRLRSNDLLIVEGHGNPNEIGRCARWTGEIEDCVHQNHLIRARFGEEVINSTYAEHHLNSSKGRRHLVKSGKTTSGLNTISTSNVKDCPMPVPPIELQREFAHRVSAIQLVKNRFLTQLTDLDTLFASLENRAFKGEL
jgi:type I restriction enzyme S subunit